MNMKAWVLDDEEGIRTMVGDILAQHGYKTRIYATPVDAPWCGGEAEPSASGDSVEPDVIVSDIRMPHLTGLEFVRALRDIGGKTRHIALMSGDWHPDDLLEAQSLGCKVFHKPFPIASLVEWIRSLAPDPAREARRGNLVTSSV